MLSFSVIIPARYAATRLPGKPLRDIAGKPLIQRTYECAMESQAERVVVATDDAGIARVVESFNGVVCMTRSDHPTGTDRLAEAAEQLGLDDEQIIVNLQGDEPCVPGRLINQVAECLANSPQAALATLCLPFVRREEIDDPNVVKVVLDHEGYALYFSRAPIPFRRDDDDADDPIYRSQMRRHVGLYAYRVSYLADFVTRAPSPLERVEKLEQLRALWYGHRIAVANAGSLPGPGVDTLADLEEVIQFFEHQPR